MDGKYMVNERYSFKLSNYARDLVIDLTYFNDAACSFPIVNVSPQCDILRS
jgi:hypothetical protein